MFLNIDFIIEVSHALLLPHPYNIFFFYLDVNTFLHRLSIDWKNMAKENYFN